jgi:hypothetical protein
MQEVCRVRMIGTDPGSNMIPRHRGKQDVEAGSMITPRLMSTFMETHDNTSNC